MYLEAVIKASFPKVSDLRVEIDNKVSSVFDKCLRAEQQSHEQRHTIRPLAHWLKKISDKKRGIPINTRGLKTPLMKKRHC
jgi:hypothetical protein